MPKEGFTEFIVVEPSFKRLPEFYLTTTKMENLILVPDEIKETGNVGLARMVDTYMFIGFSIVSECLTANSLHFHRRLDGVSMILYYDVDLSEAHQIKELQEDLEKCTVVCDNSCCGKHEPLPKSLLPFLPSDLTFIGDTANVRYAELYSAEDMVRYNTKRTFLHPEHEDWMNFVAMGPFEGYNYLISTLLYHPKLSEPQSAL